MMMMIIKDRRFGTQENVGPIYTGLRIHYSIRVQAYIYDCTVSFSTITSRDVIVRVIVHSAAIFSERELIICGPSACRLSVTLVHSTQAVVIFRNISTAFWYLDHPLTYTNNFTEIIPGEPLRRGS